MICVFDCYTGLGVVSCVQLQMSNVGCSMGRPSTLRFPRLLFKHLSKTVCAVQTRLLYNVKEHCKWSEI